MITLAALVTLLFALVIIGLIVYVLLWALKEIAPPEPINKIAKTIIILFAAFVLIMLLLPYAQLK